MSGVIVFFIVCIISYFTRGKSEQGNGSDCLCGPAAADFPKVSQYLQNPFKINEWVRVIDPEMNLKMFPCPHCRQKFDNDKALQLHLKFQCSTAISKQINPVGD